MKILAIGNSFSEDATRYLEPIARSAGEELFVRNLYIGGCSLFRHVKNIESGDAAYAYQRDAESLEQISLSDALAREDWDFITVQQVSGYSGIYDSYIPYLDRLLSFVRERAPRAKRILHRTWAYEWNETEHPSFQLYSGDTAKMHRAIVDVTDRISKEFSLPIIPVGDAIMRAKCHPDFDVRAGGLSLHRDGFHLSRDYGRYLAALVWLKYFTGVSPDRVTFIPEGCDPHLIATIKQFV